MRLPVYDITPYTLIDYPDHASCVVWFSGCNMKCKYCYNPLIIPFDSGTKHMDELYSFLDTRIGLLDAVVLSGGEATTFKGLIEVCEVIKSKGFKIKLDTNGSNPKMIKTLLEKKLVDFISLDIKSLDREKVIEVTGIDIKEDIAESLLLIQYYNILFECRTTVHSDLYIEEDIVNIINSVYILGYRGTYGLQLALDNVDTVGNLKNTNTYDTKSIKEKTDLEIDFRNF